MSRNKKKNKLQLRRVAVPAAIALAGTLAATDVSAQDRSCPQMRGVSDGVSVYSFKVEIDGLALGSFKDVTGLKANVEVIEFEDGEDLAARRPSRTKFGDITFKRDYVENQDLKKWWESLQNGREDKRSLNISMIEGRSPICKWVAKGTFPKAWKVNGFDGKGNDVVTEEIVFVVEQMIFEK